MSQLQTLFSPSISDCHHHEEYDDHEVVLDETHRRQGASTEQYHLQIEAEGDPRAAAEARERRITSVLCAVYDEALR